MARPACPVEPGIKAYAEKVIGLSALAGFVYPVVEFSDNIETRKEYYIEPDPIEEDYPEEYRRSNREDYPRDDRYNHPRNDGEDNPDDKSNDNPENSGYYLMTLLGLYIPEENKIIIYEKAHGYDGPGEADIKEAYIRQTIAHELFHAIHYFLAPKTCYLNSKESHVVKEALADYFSYSFSMDEAIARDYGYAYLLSTFIADGRYDFWRHNIRRGLSYAHAIYMESHPFTEYEQIKELHNDIEKTVAFCTNSGVTPIRYRLDWIDNESSILKLLSVLEMSKYDMYSAYVLLVPERERRIRSRITYRKDDYVVVEVEFSHGNTWYSYLFDPTDRLEIKCGDKVLVTTHGRDQYVTVRDVKVMNKYDYDAYLFTKGFNELKDARRG